VASDYQIGEERRRDTAELRAAAEALRQAEAAELDRTAPGLAGHTADLHDLSPGDASYRGEYTG
jgi:hypothetical protein